MLDKLPILKNKLPDKQKEKLKQNSHGGITSIDSSACVINKLIDIIAELLERVDKIEKVLKIK